MRRLILVFALLLQACVALNPGPPARRLTLTPAAAGATAVSGPGHFLISRAGFSTKQAGASAFDLGPLSEAAVFYFIVQNDGGSDITGVTATSSLPGVTLNISQLAVLHPIGQTSVLPMLAVNINHGRFPGKSGFTDLLPGGNDSATITLTGTSAGQATSITFTLTMDARFTDIQLISEGAAMTMPSGNRFNLNNATGLGSVATYTFGPDANLNPKVPSIRNTGNVSVRVTLLGSTTTVLQDKGSLAVGATIVLPAPFTVTGAGDSNGVPYYILVLDGGAVTPDLRRLDYGTDGKVYLRIAQN